MLCGMRNAPRGKCNSRVDHPSGATTTGEEMTQPTVVISLDLELIWGYIDLWYVMI